MTHCPGVGASKSYPHTPVDNYPPDGDKYPPGPVSPLIYDKMTEIGGTIPSVNQKKFLGKIDPHSKSGDIYRKKNFGKFWYL